MSHRTREQSDRASRVLEPDGAVPTRPEGLSQPPGDRSRPRVLIVALALGLAIIAIAVGLALAGLADEQGTGGLESASPPQATVNQNDTDAVVGIPAPAPATLGTGVVVIEVSDRPGNGPGIDRIALRNVTEATLDISGWEVQPASGEGSMVIPEGVVIEPGRSVTIFEMNIVGERCRPDTPTVLFTCNALGLERTTRDVIFATPAVRVVDGAGALVAESE